MKEVQFSDRVKIVSEAFQTGIWIYLDGVCTLRVCHRATDAMKLAERIAMFLTVMDGPAWEPAWRGEEPLTGDQQTLRDSKDFPGEPRLISRWKYMDPNVKCPDCEGRLKFVEIDRKGKSPQQWRYCTKCKRTVGHPLKGGRESLADRHRDDPAIKKVQEIIDKDRREGKTRCVLCTTRYDMSDARCPHCDRETTLSPADCSLKCSREHTDFVDARGVVYIKERELQD